MTPASLAGGTRNIPFTFTVRLDEEFAEGMELDCVGEAAAIEAAREVLRATISDRPALAGPAQRGTIGVGIGSLIDAPDRVIWLGEWEWSAADGWSWTSSD
jgi:hypothetical protein